MVTPNELLGVGFGALPPRTYPDLRFWQSLPFRRIYQGASNVARKITAPNDSLSRASTAWQSANERYAQQVKEQEEALQSKKISILGQPPIPAKSLVDIAGTMPGTGMVTPSSAAGMGKLAGGIPKIGKEVAKKTVPMEAVKKAYPLKAPITREDWTRLKMPDKAELVKQFGLEGKTASKSWDNLTGDELRKLTTPVTPEIKPLVETPEIVAAKAKLEPTKAEPVVKTAEPPIKPPTVPPVATAAAGGAKDPIKAFWTDANAQAKAAEAATQKMKTKWDAERFAEFQKELAQNQGKMSAEQAVAEASSTLAKKMPFKPIEFKEVVPPNVRDTMFQMVQDYYSRGGDIKGATNALEKLLDTGRLVVSDKPSGQYKLLSNVFGEDVVLAIDDLATKLSTSGGSGKTTIWQNIAEPKQLAFEEQAATKMFGETPSTLTGIADARPLSVRTLDSLDLFLADAKTNIKYGTTLAQRATNVEAKTRAILAQGLLKGEINITDYSLAYKKLHTAFGEALPYPSMEAELQRLIEEPLRPLGTLKDRIALKTGGLLEGSQMRLLPKTAQERVNNVFQLVGNNLIDGLNTLRASVSSLDISIYRQAAVAAARDPLTAVKALKPTVRSMLDGKYATEFDAWIRTQKGATVLEPYGLELTALPGSKLAKTFAREESFMTRWADAIPYVRWSNRAFVNGLNYIRASRATKLIEGFEKVGIKLDKPQLEGLAQLINVTTGRGSLGSLNKYAPAANAFFFSPRFMAAHFQLPAILFNPNTPRAVRVEAWKNVGAFLGEGAAILGLGQLTGLAKVETDSRSPDFGKLVIGNTRLDIWGGYIQYIRLASQLINQQKKTSNGMLVPINTKETLLRFLQSKESPAAALFDSLISGQTYSGEKMSATSEGIKEQVYQRVTPLSIQDMVDGFMQSGLLGVATAAPTLFGVGVTAYTNEVQKIEDKVAKDLGYSSWADLGQKGGIAKQLWVEQQHPEIEEQRTKNELAQAGGSSSVTQRYYKDGRETEDAYKQAITTAANNFKRTGDGTAFRKAVEDAAQNRRYDYSKRAKKPEYDFINAFYSAPIPPEKAKTMYAGDVYRREYQGLMYGADMYNPDGSYNFDRADNKEKYFSYQYGEEALNYVKQY